MKDQPNKGGRKPILNEEQLKWLKENYNEYTTKELSTKLNIGKTTLWRIARKLNIQKSKEYLSKIGYERLQKVGHPMLKIIQTDPDRFRKINAEKSRRQKEKVAKAKIRKKYGLPYNIPDRMLITYPYTATERDRRYNALKKGYILGDTSEEHGERKVLFYDGETNRSSRFEKESIKRGFKILPL